MRNLVRRGAGAAALSGAMLLAGCGSFGDGFFQDPTSGSGTTTSGGDYVFSVNSDSTVSAFEVGSGALTAISGNPVTPGSAYSATVTRPDTYLFVGGASAIYCYAIGTSGALTEQSSGGYSIGSGQYVQMDTSPNGNLLVTLSQVTGTAPVVTVFTINTSSCLLTAVSTTPIPLTSTAAEVNTSLHVSPNGAFVGVALGAGGDYIYPLTQSSGALGTPQVIASAAGSEDNTLIFDPTSSYVYVGRYGLAAGTGSVVTYSLSSAGVATQLSSVASGNTVKSLLVNTAGTTAATELFSANFSDATISGYSIAAGVLTQVTGSPFDSSAGVSSLALDNSGKYVIAAATGGTGITDLTLYEFDPLNAQKLNAVQTYANGSGTTGSIAVATTH